MIATHIIQDISFDEVSMTLNIDGKTVRVLLDDISPKLKAASEIQRNLYKISPSGYGIHWPLIDEDLSVEGILKLYGA